MPPASPETTLVERMASSSEVLPWSTWPMMVTTGGRGTCDRFVGGVEQAFLDVGFGHALDRMAHLLGDELRGVGVDRVGDLEHLPLLHQQRDHSTAPLGHAVGEFLDGDGFRDRHFADELVLRLVVAVTVQTLGAAAERRDRAFAHLVGGERGHERQTAAALLDGRRRGLRGAAGRAAPVLLRRRGAGEVLPLLRLRAGRGPGCGGRPPELSSPLASSRSLSRLGWSSHRNVSWRPRRPCAWSPRRVCGAFLRRPCGLPRPRARRARSRRAPSGSALLPRRSCVLRPRAAARRQAHARAPSALPRSASATPRRTASAEAVPAWQFGQEPGDCGSNRCGAGAATRSSACRKPGF